MQNVKMVKLGDVAEFINGYAFKPTDWHPDEQGLPIIRIQNLNDETKPFNYFSGSVPEKYYVDDGALLFSWSGTPGTSFGAFFWNRGRAVVNQHIFRVVWGERVDPVYFRYAINNTLEHIISQAHGGVGLKHITKGKLLNVEIPFPPLPEQKRIAEILDLADEARRKRRENLKLYDDLIRSLFLQTFGDPVSNPMGWKEQRFDILGTLERGKSRHRPRNDPKLLGGKHALIQTGDVSNADWFIRKYNQTYSDLGLQQSRMWPKGTLCITIAANIADAAILNFDACFPDSVVGFTPGGCVNNSYVMCWLFFLKKLIEVKAPAVAQKNINLRILGDLELPVPPIDLQNQFAKQVEEINAQKAREQALYDQHDDLFNSLLQRAFKGEL